jgi:hypothetical protein
VSLPEFVLLILFFVAGLVIGDEERRQQTRKRLAEELCMTDEELRQLRL